MKNPWIVRLIALLLLLTAPATAQPGRQQPPGMGQQEAEQQPPPKAELVELHKMFPFLQWNLLNTWKQEITAGQGEVPKESRGCFPVGDGWVFAYQGMGRQANTLQGITGPTYDGAGPWEPEGNFGELTLELHVGGKVIPLPRQRLGMVRGAPIVLSEDSSENGIVLRSATLAWSSPRVPTDMEGVEAGQASLDPFRCSWGKDPHRTIYRLIDIYNGTDSPLTEVELVAVFSKAGEEQAGSLTLSAGGSQELPRGRRLLARFQERSRTEGGILSRSFDEIAPGKLGRAILLLHTYFEDQPRPDPDDYLEDDCVSAFGEASGWWHLRLQHTTRFRCDDRKWSDLVEAWKFYAILQQALPGGAPVSMVNHRLAAVRDGGGALLIFLRTGMWNEARKLLDYYYNQIRFTGKVEATFPPGTVFPPDLADPDWASLEVSDNETAAWLLLQHYWYYRATQDWELLRERWPLLRRLLDAQKPHDGLLFPVAATNPATHGGFYSVFPERTDYPNELIADLPGLGRRAWSFEGSLLYVQSIHALSDICSVLHARDERKLASWEQLKNDLMMRALQAGTKLEERFWQARPGAKQEPGKLMGRYLPAFSPVTMEPHTAPYAPFNLLPLWVGFLFATGNRDNANVRESVGLLWQDRARVGATPTVSRIPGFLQGYLVANLTFTEDKSQPDALAELVRMASPSGEWAEVHNRDGKPTFGADRRWPARLRLLDGGVNLDAMLYGLTGIRYAAVPAFDPTTLRLNPRVPKGAGSFAGDGLKHDGRLFDYSIHLEADRVNVRLLNRADKRLDVAIGLLHNMYIRYIEPNRDEYINEVAPGVFISKDNPGFREDIFSRGNRLTWQPRPLQLPPPGTDVILLTARPETRARLEGRGTIHVVDVGLPMSPEQLAQILVQPDGQPRARVLVYDAGVRETRLLTMKTTTFWQDPLVLRAEENFRKSGGRVEQL